MISVSIVVPFYDGNKYLERLFRSIIKPAKLYSDIAKFEVVLVNDSPDIPILLPDLNDTNLEIVTCVNERNFGIQRTRIEGLRCAKGEWIIFLDQDDELVCDGFANQLRMALESDVVVGNGIYIMGAVNKQIFKNKRVMQYLIRKKNFIKIRNLIPSPGECMIRKSVVPETWLNSIMENNGADDWLLWLTLFAKNANFLCNDELVYIHNDSEGQNLSANLDKMYVSGKEMYSILEERQLLKKNEYKQLKHAIEFKYYQDSRKLSPLKVIRYIDSIFYNVCYKLKVAFL